MDRSSDPYVVLGVERTGNPREIRHAFRQLVTRYHPDRAGEEAADRYEEILEAYRRLSDPQEKESYDREHPEELAAAGEGSIPIRRRPEPEPPLEESEPPLARRPLSLFEDFWAPRSAIAQTFERLLRNFTGAHVPKSEQLRPLDLEIVLTPEQARRGGTLNFAVPTFRQCPVCEGTGSHLLFPCLACDKQGLIEDRESVRLAVAPGVRPGAIYEVPLHGLGIHNAYLRVHLQVGSG